MYPHMQGNIKVPASLSVRGHTNISDRRKMDVCPMINLTLLDMLQCKGNEGNVYEQLNILQYMFM